MDVVTRLRIVPDVVLKMAGKIGRKKMLQINSKLFQRIVAKILTKSLKKTVGIDTNIDITNMDIQWTEEDCAKGTVSLNFALTRKDILKVSDTIINKINA